MKKILKITILIAGLVFIILPGCVKDLDTIPLDEDVTTAATVFDDPASYKQVLGKLYAGLAVSGQEGPSGDADISGIDEGFGQYLRGFWYHQELTTDEAVIGWNDQTVKDFHWQTWGASDVFIAAMYYRIFYQISATNEFIRETTDEKLDERGVSEQLRTDIGNYRAEARWLRALSYWHALDLFANVPFVTEDDPVGAFFPSQIQRSDLYSWLIAELEAIEGLMVDARANEYGRADKGAVWMLLAKIYLNADVYVGQNRATECITNCKKVIEAGYQLEPEYEHLFLADNSDLNEVIFSINFDGAFTKTWGGTTFIIHAAVGGDMPPGDFGIDGGWGGTRTTSALVHKFFPDLTSSPWSFPGPGRASRDYPVLYVPGSYQGWDPENTTTVLGSVNSDGNYEGYLYFAEANTMFKFTPQPNWDYDWGDDDADGTLDVGGTDITVADPGYYKINVDTNALTYTYEKTEWGVIGSATAGGWDADQDMTYDPETGYWTALLDLTAGAIKFRANDDWALNYGDDGADGILAEGAADIVIPSAGTFMVKLKLGAPDYTYSITTEGTIYDHRAMFFTEGQTLEIDDLSNFNEGYAVTKFKNVTRDGANGSDLTFVDTDFPMFRLADVYLMYAEAVLSGGSGGDMGTALDYVNMVRERAYNSPAGNIEANELDLPFILDERARELYWEGHRRTDLVRHGLFTGGDYLWQWKGDARDGRATDVKYDIFPIPDADIGANPNLQQNTGY